MRCHALSLRVGQLGSVGTRAHLACTLRGAVEIARRPPAALGSPGLQRSEVRANRELLLELADRIESGGSLGARGLAMASLLVSDASSALYRQDASRSLAATAFEALITLERGDRIAGITDR